MANGVIKGFDIDVARAIGVAKGYEIELYPLLWTEIENRVKNGSLDMCCMTNLEERHEFYDFSKPIFNPNFIYYIPF